MLARLIATGSLGEKGCPFWDEPEANLKPKLLREIACVILGLCESGVQVVVATRSLFPPAEIDVLGSGGFQSIKRRHFALRYGEHGVEILQGDSVNDVKPLLVLDEEVEQSGRCLESRAP